MSNHGSPSDTPLWAALKILTLPTSQCVTCNTGSKRSKKHKYQSPANKLNGKPNSTLYPQQNKQNMINLCLFLVKTY